MADELDPADGSRDKINVMFILWAKKYAYETKKRQDRGEDPWVDPQRGRQHLHYHHLYDTRYSPSNNC